MTSVGSIDCSDVGSPVLGTVEPITEAYIRYVEKSKEERYEAVEYDMDEEDLAWLELVNEQRNRSHTTPISQDTFELLMDRFEKESLFQCQSFDHTPGAPASTSSLPPTSNTDDDDAVCAVCLDGECYIENVILFCDVCNLAVHQACYGVPSIPAAEWLCRHCLQSPSKPLECCLCPSRSGAVKRIADESAQTVAAAALSKGATGKWAHITCAYWIPEVGFGDNVFLDPIVGVDRIAPSRWKMICNICHLQGVGACVQCSNANCSTGFHVTCAQLAGLYMKARLQVDSTTGKEIVKKTVYCDQHSVSSGKKGSEEGADVRSKECKPHVRRARKTIAESQTAPSRVYVPVITVNSISKISKRVSLEQKEAFMSRLHCYWTLKRQSRDGAPLLPSLQLKPLLWNNCILRLNGTKKAVEEEKEDTSQQVVNSLTLSFLEFGVRKDKLPITEDTEENVRIMRRLREELERVRNLVQLIQQREKLKCEKVKLKEKQCKLELQPVMLLLSRTLRRLQEKEIRINSLAGITSTPDSSGKSIESTRLSHMQERLVDLQYTSVDDFIKDFDQTISNCLNEASTKSPLRDCLLELKKQGEVILDSLKRQSESADYDPITGMHAVPVRTGNVLKKSTDKQISPGSTSGLSHQSYGAEAVESHAVGKGMKRNRMISSSKGRGRPRKLTGSSSSDLRSPEREKDMEVDDNPSDVIGGNVGDSAAVIPESKAAQPVAAGEVNRRTAVLFNNKIRKSGKSSSCKNSPEEKINDDSSSKSSKGSRPGTKPPKMTALTPDEENLNKDNSDREMPTLKSKTLSVMSDCEKEKPDRLAAKDSKLDVAKFGKQHDQEKLNVDKPKESSKKKRASLENQQENVQHGMPSLKIPAQQKRESFMQYRSLSDGDVESDSEAARVRAEEKHDKSDSDSGSEGGGGGKGRGRGGRRESSSSGSGSSNESGSESSDTESNPDKHSVEAGWSSDSGGDDDDDDDATPLKPFDLVWAKCKGYPWYPGMMIDPKMTKSDCVHNGIPVPVPPPDVQALRLKYNITVHLVLFFDAKRTWQYLPPNKIERLGIDQALDNVKLKDCKKPNIRKAVQTAYDKALMHRPNDA